MCAMFNVRCSPHTGLQSRIDIEKRVGVKNAKKHVLAGKKIA